MRILNKGTSVTYGHLADTELVYHSNKLNPQYFLLNFFAVCQGLPFSDGFAHC